MDLLRVRREGIQPPRHPVVKPRADVQHHVAAMHREVSFDRAVHPQHTDELRVGGRVGAQPHQGGGAGRAAEPHQFPQGSGRVRSGVDHAAAAVHDRSPGPLQQRHGPANLRQIGLDARTIGAMWLLGRRRVGRGSDQHILRQVDHHRPWPTAGGDGERLVDDARQVLPALHQIVVLRRRAGDSCRIGLLEGVIADQMRRHLACEADHGDTVHQRVDQAGHGIGGTWPAGDQHDTDLARGSGIAFRRVHRRLLVPHEDVADGVLVEDRVVNRQHCTAWIAEHDLHALILQGLEQDFGAGPVGAGGVGHALGLRAGIRMVNPTH